MKKKYYLLFILCLILIPFNEVKGDSFSVDMDCPAKSSYLTTIKCTISVKSDFDINNIKMDVTDSSNSTIKFKSSDSIDAELVDSELTIGSVSSGTITLGTIEVKSNALKDTVKTNKTIKLSNIVGTKKNSTTVNASNISKDVYLQSMDNSLKSLEIVGYTIDFSKYTHEYEINVTEDVNNVEIKATANDTDAKVEGIGTKTLTSGKNTFKIVVTAEDGGTNDYIVNIIKPGETIEVKPTGKGDNYLTKFEVLGYDILIDKDKYDYTITVDNKVNKIATCTDNADKENYFCILEVASNGDSEHEMYFNDISSLKISEEYSKNIVVKENDLGGYDGYLDDILIWQTNEDGLTVYAAVPFGDIKVGENILKIVVSADNEYDKTYNFKIIREDTTGGKPSQEDVDKSPDTGNALILVAWTIGLGALGYSIYWFQKRREEL